MLPCSRHIDAGTALGVRINAQEGVDTGGDDVVADGNRLFGHIFRRAADDRNLSNIDAPVLGDVGSENHHTGNINAGAHVQDRRDVDQLADALETFAAQFLGFLAQSSPAFAAACAEQPETITMISFAISFFISSI